MEILTTVTVLEKTLTIGDSWNIGNNNVIHLKELFIIDGEVYMATTLNDQPINMKINKTNTDITVNRYINPATKWVGENIDLFN